MGMILARLIIEETSLSEFYGTAKKTFLALVDPRINRKGPGLDIPTSNYADREAPALPGHVAGWAQSYLQLRAGVGPVGGALRERLKLFARDLRTLFFSAASVGQQGKITAKPSVRGSKWLQSLELRPPGFRNWAPYRSTIWNL